jgi:hypothetical protein
VSNDYANCKKIQQKLAEKRYSIRVEDIFEIVKKEFISKVKVACQGYKGI